MRQHRHNILSPDPHDHRDMGQKIKIQFFQNMFMLLIKLKGLTKCSYMAANILPADPLPQKPRDWV